jgi:hypothetical protein
LLACGINSSYQLGLPENGDVMTPTVVGLPEENGKGDLPSIQ